MDPLCAPMMRLGQLTQYRCHISKVCDESIHPFANFSGTTVISSHTLLGM